jgi:hypothetical protein
MASEIEGADWGTEVLRRRYDMPWTAAERRSARRALRWFVDVYVPAMSRAYDREPSR